MNTLTIKELVEKLIEAKEKYYQGNPIMDDFTFDTYEDQLRQLDPGNDYFKVVGSPIQGNIKMKIKHQFPMLSMAKGKSINDIEKWLNKISDRRLQIIIEPKIDGLSFTAVYENEKLQHIATRGDGTTGQIITHIAEYVDIPKTIDVLQRVEVRGELYLPKNCKVDNPNNSPLRNVAVGLINRKDSGLEDLKHIKYISYQVIGTDMTTEEGKIKWLRSLGFTTVSYNLVGSIKEIEEYFQTYKETGRDNWLFETDGLILAVNDCKLHESINSKYVVSHHNWFNIALKPESESRWTEVEGITWGISKQGNLVPVVNIKEVTIGNANIKNVTANNYLNVKNLKINIGDKIHVARSNDVIPFLIETIPTKDKSELIPTHCPSCYSVLIENGNVHIRCINPGCPEMNIQLITSWVKSNELDGVSEATIRLLYEKDFIKSIIDIYLLKMKAKYLKLLNGMGEKKVTNLLEQIEKSKNMTIVQFLGRLSIDLIGEKAINKLGIKTIQDLWDFNDSTYVIGQNLIAYRNENKKMIEELLSVLNVSNVKQTNSNSQKVCMTGAGPKGRKELIKDIEAKGYQFVEAINKETNILICEDINSNSTKLQKAVKLGIKLMTYTEFFN